MLVGDGNGGNQLASNTLTISPLNDAPERVAGNVSTLFLVEDAPLTSMGLGVEYGVGGAVMKSHPSRSHTVAAFRRRCWSHLHSRRWDNDDDVGLSGEIMEGMADCGW